MSFSSYRKAGFPACPKLGWLVIRALTIQLILLSATMGVSGTVRHTPESETLFETCPAGPEGACHHCCNVRIRTSPEPVYFQQPPTPTPCLITRFHVTSDARANWLRSDLPAPILC